MSEVEPLSALSKRVREDTDDDADANSSNLKRVTSTTDSELSESPRSEDPLVLAQAAAASLSNLLGLSDESSASHSRSIPPTISGEKIIIHVSQDKVGSVIGSKGIVIQEMQQRSGAKIFVNQNFPDGVPREVIISGQASAMKVAVELVNKVIEAGPTALHVNSISGGPTINTTIDCAQDIVGRVIGSGGSTIKEIQARSGAKVQIEQNFPEGYPRKVNISGTHAAVAEATRLVSHVMQYGPNLPPQPGAPPSMPIQMSSAPLIYGVLTQSTGTSNNRTIDIPKAYVGKIIGKKGDTITTLQAKSGCKVQVDQQVPEGQPCKIKLQGTPQTMLHAEQLIQELVREALNQKSTGGMMVGGGGGGVMPGLGHSGMGMGMMPGMQSPMGSPMGMMGWPSNMPQNPYGMQQAPGGGMQGYPMNQQMNPYSTSPVQSPYAFQPQGQTQPMPTQPQQLPAYPGYPQQPTPLPTSPVQSQMQPTPQPQAYPYGTQPQPLQGYYQHLQPQPLPGYPTTYPTPTPAPQIQQPAAPPVPVPAPSPWTEYKDGENHSYWHNSATGQSQWEKPPGL